MKRELTFKKFDALISKNPIILNMFEEVTVRKDLTSSPVDIDLLNTIISSEAEKCTYIYDNFKDNMYQISVNLRENKKSLLQCNDKHLLAMILILEQCPNDDENPNHFGGIIALSIIINCLNQSHINELLLNSETNDAFLSTLNCLHSFNKVRTPIPATLLYDFHILLQKHRIPFKTLVFTMECIVQIAADSYLMIPSIKQCTENDESGFLAFVCLSVILSGKQTKTLDIWMRQKLIYFMFHSVESTLKDMMARKLTPVQQGTIVCNFRALIRQVKDELCEDVKAPVYAFFKLSKIFPESKSLVFELNQLTFEAYSMLVDLAVKTAKIDSDPEKQAFCFNMLESPYIGDESVDLNGLSRRLVEAILWGFKTKNLQIMLRTVQYFNKILHLEDLDTVLMLKEFLKSHPHFHATYALNYIYQFCNVNWEPEIKVMNQFFIKCACRIFLLLEDLSENSFEQTRLLVSSADTYDLIPCITDFIQMAKKAKEPQSQMVAQVLDKMVQNALSPSLAYTTFLEALFNHMYDSQFLIIIFDLKLNVHGLVKQMIKQQLINERTIQPLFETMMHNLPLWRLVEIILPLMPHVRPPHTLYQYWDMFKNDPFVWYNPNISVMFTIVGTYAENSIPEGHCHAENTFFNELLFFILESIRSKKLPAVFAATALSAARSLVKHTSRHETDFLNYFIELESKIFLSLYSNIVENGANAERSHVLSREIQYFGELCANFSCFKGFIPNQGCIDSIIDSMALIDYTNLEYSDLIDAIITCTSKISLRSKDNGDVICVTFSAILKNWENVSDRVLLRTLISFADIVTRCTGEFDKFLAEITKFISVPSTVLQQQAVKIIWQLIKGKCIVPTPWLMCALAHNFLDLDVLQMCDYQCDTEMRTQIEQHVGRYLIHIMVFFNEFYDHSEYSLTPEHRSILPPPGIPLDQRHIIYRFILDAFAENESYHILKELYTNIVDKFFSLSLRYPRNYELLQDVIVVTYISLRQGNRHFSKSREMDYKNTTQVVVKLLQTDVTSERPETEPEIDDMVRLILTSLLKFLKKKMNNQIKTIVPELFHLLLAICDWHRENIIGILIDNGANSEFKRLLAEIPKFYSKNRGLFHFEAVHAAVPINNTSVYYRF